MVLGELPNMSSRLRSIGLVPLVGDSNINLLSFVTFPTTYIGDRSRFAIFSSISRFFSETINPFLSCDSFPNNSLFERVGSPTGKASRLIKPPVSSTNSDKQFK